jgi:phosphoglycerate dehydrogenase-like enzyme
VQTLRIIFHGEVTAAFHQNFADLLSVPAQVTQLPLSLNTDAERDLFASADVIVGWKFDRSVPAPAALKLYHVPAAGYENIDLEALPASAVVCNCFGHEQTIAEYVMGALLMHNIPFADADRHLRTGDWKYTFGPAESIHGGLAGKTIGLLGFGHIGKAIAQRAKAFDMTVHVANRSAVADSALVDRSFLLTGLSTFWGTADVIVVSLPLTPETTGLVGAEAFSAMKRSAVVINVGRGPTVDERSLFEALKSQRIAGAVIDTWYNYPSPAVPRVYPSSLPFHTLPNVVMTPHMSGWTQGTIRRRQRTIADNIERLVNGQPCLNVVRSAHG